jgi:OOP family OmpA-OmpF porin
MMKKSCVVAAALAFAAPACFAQQFLQKTYVGVSGGQSNTKLNNTDFAGAAGSTRSDDKNDTAYKLFAGYRFTPNWAIEGGYADLGKARRVFTSATGTQTANVENSAWFAAGKGTLWATPTLGVFGKLGLTRNMSDLGITTATVPATAGGSATHTRTGTLFGAGVEWAWMSNVSLRVEYEDFGNFGNQTSATCVTVCETGRSRTNLFSVGLTYSF